MPKEKRIISVGFIEPEGLERDIIYVTLTPHGGTIRADVISKKEFFYYSEKDTTKLSGTKCDNCINPSSEGTPIYNSHWVFIEMLRKENDAKVSRHRMEIDGFKLSKLLQEIHYNTGIIKTF